jgi:hypothetical protein
MSKHVFLTFANTGFMSLDRITKQAKEIDIFDEIYPMSEHNIPEYIEKHRNFINQHRYGYGSFIWKPKIIFDMLHKINDNDILVYADGGTYINKDGKSRFQFYLDQLINKEIVVFNTTEKYLGQYYAKMDAIMSYHPEFRNKRTCSQLAGLMIIRKTESTINLITDWLSLCENYHFLDNSLSLEYNELSIFKGQDTDNGLFSLCVDKYNDIVSYIPPGEVMIYAENGRQAAHEMEPHQIDWSSLYDKPFQCRRMAPRPIFPIKKADKPRRLIKWLKV